MAGFDYYTKLGIVNILDPDQIINLIPRATVWANSQEQRILEEGMQLSRLQLEDAKKIPVKYPENIRLLYVEQIPLPRDPELKLAAQNLRLITPDTIGLTLQYGIFIRKDFWNYRETVVHELVHTSQYERLGGIQKFLNQYIPECMQFGYPNAPLEQEAINKARLICT